MTRRGTSLFPLVVVNRALLDIVDRLQAEFPEVPLVVVYERVADARVGAIRHLPNIAAFSAVVEQQARERLCAVTVDTVPVGWP